MSAFNQHLRRQNPDVPDIYFTLLEAAKISPSLVFNQNAKAKDRGRKGPLQSMNVRSCRDCIRVVLLLTVLYPSWQKASRLPVSKVKQFLHSKAFYTKFTLATPKIKRMRAFARSKTEIWC